jgi:hypothetical protein
MAVQDMPERSMPAMPALRAVTENESPEICLLYYLSRFYGAYLWLFSDN